MRKLNAAVAVWDKVLYLTGTTPVHQWEITSHVWAYSLTQRKWRELEEFGNHSCVGDGFKNKEKKTGEKNIVKPVK
jgi:hypothetical protein